MAASAFPVNAANLGGPGAYAPEPGMDLRDWFATFAPEPSDEAITLRERADIARNPHNDSHKPRRRSREEIVAQLRYERADAMLAARKDTP